MKRIVAILSALVLFMFASSLCFAVAESNVSSTSPNVKEMSSQTQQNRKIPWPAIFVGVLLLILVIGGALVESGVGAGFPIMLGAAAVMVIAYIIDKIIGGVATCAGCLSFF